MSVLDEIVAGVREDLAERQRDGVRWPSCERRVAEVPPARTRWRRSARPASA